MRRDRFRDAFALGVTQGAVLGGLGLGGWYLLTGRLFALPFVLLGVFAAWIWWADWRFAITPLDKRAQRPLPAVSTEESTDA